jgi:NADH:ubiquinone oxidoreductase subunit K
MSLEVHEGGVNLAFLSFSYQYIQLLALVLDTFVTTAVVTELSVCCQ